MPHTVIDNVLVIAWIALFLLAAALLLQLPVSDLITAGYGEYISTCQYTNRCLKRIFSDTDISVRICVLVY